MKDAITCVLCTGLMYCLTGSLLYEDLLSNAVTALPFIALGSSMHAVIQKLQLSCSK